LKNKDLTSKSDPCCVIYTKNASEEWNEIGRTETIQNNLNPTFQRSFELDYIFDEIQQVRFEVYDIDNKSEKLTDDDFLGQVETSVAEIVSESPMTKPLIDRKSGKLAGGTITLRVTETNAGGASADVLELSFKGEKLDKKDKFGKSDPFLEFSRKIGDDFQVVHRTEFVKNNQNPVWQPFKIRAHQLSGGDYKNPIMVECKDYNSNGKHDLIGCFETTVTELIKDASGHQWPCINESLKSKKKKYENSGIISLVKCQVKKCSSAPYLCRV
jgi:Ca2+-dependent lipid-binding protein